jgi:predicted 3-demethylubiquinone-9 3-methyltransferase (glyoxalase superfamily)
MVISTENQSALSTENKPSIPYPQQITPFLWFNGNVEEAVNFYTAVFEDSKIVSMNYLPGEVPGRKGKVVSATFELNGMQFMALNGGPLYSFTPAISFFVHCGTQEEVDRYWEKLTVGGETMRCGWLKDKYGISWQIVPGILGKLLGGPNPAKAGNAMKAMMQMIKLDIAALQKAYDEG